MMKKLLLAKLAAGLFVIGVCGMFTSAQAVPTFTFSPHEGGSKTLLTLSGQTQDRSDTVPLPNVLYYTLFDDVLEDYITTDAIQVPNPLGPDWPPMITYGTFSFTEGLEGLKVESTLQWDPVPEIPPEHLPAEPAGYPKTGMLSPVTSLLIDDDGPRGDLVPDDDFVLEFANSNGGFWAEPAGLSPLLFTETLTFSGSAILDMDFSLLNAGTYRGHYLGERLNVVYLREGLHNPTFEIVVTPEPTTILLFGAAFAGLAGKRAGGKKR